MKRREFAPCWGLPTEIFLITTNPSFLSKPAAQTAGLGLFQAFDPMDFEETIGPTKRKLPLDHITKPYSLRFTRWHAHHRGPLAKPT
eukprot:6417496-Pyramimonas_sp.AAC.1